MNATQLYRQKLICRKRWGTALAVLGIALAVLGCCMGVISSLDDPARQWAWRTFSFLGFSLFVNGYGINFKVRRLLTSPESDQKEQRIAEEDERELLLTRMANTTASYIFLTVVILVMLAALLLNQQTVYWTCCSLGLVFVLSTMLAKAWYRRQL